MAREPDAAGIEGDVAGLAKTMRLNDDIRARTGRAQVINSEVKSGHGTDAFDGNKVRQSKDTVQKCRQDTTVEQRLFRIDAKVRIERHPNPNTFRRDLFDLKRHMRYQTLAARIPHLRDLLHLLLGDV